MNEQILRKLNIDVRKLPSQTFERVIRRAGVAKQRQKDAYTAWQSFGKPGRDPSTLQGVMGVFASRKGWDVPLRIAKLRNNWNQIVGDVNAQHSTVVDYRDGVLVIGTSSPAWATQFKFMVPQLKQVITERVPGLVIQDIVIMGPQRVSRRRPYIRSKRN